MEVEFRTEITPFIIDIVANKKKTRTVINRMNLTAAMADATAIIISEKSRLEIMMIWSRFST